jgi:uncharacterized membrane protein
MAGLLVIGPLWLTGWLLFTLFVFFDGAIQILPQAWQPESLFGQEIPGLGIVLSLLFVYLFGVGTRAYAGKQLVSFYEKWLERVPIINTVYQSIKQLMSTLFSKQGAHFRDVVLVEYPRQGIYCFAFLTNDSQFLEVDGQKLLSIFLPSTPNPTTGFYLLLPVQDVLNVDLTVEEAFKLIMSAGIVAPSILRKATPYDVTVFEQTQVSKPSDANET